MYSNLHGDFSVRMKAGTYPIALDSEQFTAPGSPIEGIAIQIGKDEAWTDSEGLFTLRMKSAKDLPMSVDLDSSTAGGVWRVLSCPATIAANGTPAYINSGEKMKTKSPKFYHAHNGYRPPKVTQVPRFPDKLKEANPRSGFLTGEQYNALQANCAHPSLRAMIAIAYDFGFRKGELLGLKAKQVDMESRTIQLLPGTTKNGKGRTVRMTDEVYELMKPSPKLALAEQKGEHPQANL